MKHIQRRFRTAVIVPCLVLGATGGQAATHRVPYTYTTIQAAINAAATGDVVLISLKPMDPAELIATVASFAELIGSDGSEDRD